MNTTTATGLLVAALCTAYQGATAAQPPAPPAAAGKAEVAHDPDPTVPYRRPSALVARCGAVTVKDLGLWPDMQAAFEKGEVLEIVNCPAGGSINARGQTIVALDGTLPDGVSRSGADGVVQYVVKQRSATGKINARGDVLGQLFINNPNGGILPIKQQTFFLEAGATEPAVIDVPDGMSLTVSGFNEDGLGVGNLMHVVSDPALPADTAVFIVRDAQSGKITFKPVLDPAKLPPKLTSWGAWLLNKKGETVLNLQRPTGERNAGMFIDKNGKQQITCPDIIDTLSQCAIVRNGEIELVPIPKGIDGMSPCALTDDGTLIGMAEIRDGKAFHHHGFVWRNGTYRELETFNQVGLIQPCDADGGIICGIMSVSSTAMGAAPKDVPEARREAFYKLMGCGVLWNMETGAMLTLDSLLPDGDACTHISRACAVKGDKVLCTGHIGGKEHGLIVTLPPQFREGFKKVQ